MDIEQYDDADPEKYLKGILHSEQEPWVGNAYQSYLAVLPSPLVGFDDFAQKVRMLIFIELRRHLAILQVKVNLALTICCGWHWKIF